MKVSVNQKGTIQDFIQDVADHEDNVQTLQTTFSVQSYDNSGTQIIGDNNKINLYTRNTRVCMFDSSKSEETKKSQQVENDGIVACDVGQLEIKSGRANPGNSYNSLYRVFEDKIINIKKKLDVAMCYTSHFVFSIMLVICFGWSGWPYKTYMLYLMEIVADLIICIRCIKIKIKEPTEESSEIGK